MSKPFRKNYLEIQENLHQSSVESWKTSYSDLMTILLVFFVLLISATHVSAVKFERIKQAFQGATEQESIAAVLIELEKQVSQHQLGDLIDIQSDDKSIQISFQDGLLFDLGRADVRPEAVELLQRFTTSLDELPTYARIAVEGHTDDNPIDNGVFESNWHLSTLRSLAVLNILENMNICRENCEVRGFGEYQPKVPNRDDRGEAIAKNQSENRRVVLRIF